MNTINEKLVKLAGEAEYSCGLLAQLCEEDADNTDGILYFIEKVRESLRAIAKEVKK